MIEERDLMMLVELDRIVARYGSGTVARLAKLIKDRQRAEQLAALLESAASRVSDKDQKVTGPDSFSKSPSRPDRIGSTVLKNLELLDPEKHMAVREIRDILLNRESLKSMSDLRNFAWKHGLELGKASSRTAAIVPFLRSLSELSTPTIISIRDSLSGVNQDDRSLQSWWDVIVKPPNASSKADEGQRTGSVS